MAGPTLITMCLQAATPVYTIEPATSLLCLIFVTQSTSMHTHTCPYMVPQQVSESTGCVILPDVAAYLECTVMDRMEAGDHWVVYGRVDGGEVVEDGAVAAVHHRKTGTTY